jgi:hypothetical protein
MYSQNMLASVRPVRRFDQPERLRRADARGIDQCLAGLFVAFNSEPSLEQIQVYSAAVAGFPREALNAAVQRLSRGEGDGRPQFLPTAAEVAVECRKETARIADELRRGTPRRPPPLIEEIIPPGEWARREARVKASKLFLAEREAATAGVGRAMSMANPRPLSGMNGAQDGKPWTPADTKRRIDEIVEAVMSAGAP